ncbi:MAG TPA: dolichyl-phosphate beta-D-mannosyltransferase, partial [Myxococcales bacterium]|nr:dolichyl-phosphate beta-D-mannosyltransferase [Myxococcales bacterium]HAN32582.1 dolichyl-phosphate beta-D-mannosyltransferase [Myxococcales bacterium]
MSHPNTVICLPTYNEVENLPLMVQAIHDVVPQVDILVIDDNSPDGTGQLADKIAADDQRVYVLHRTAKEGLGRAYIAGFKWALERSYDLIFEMDCDFSHQPKYLPMFIEQAQEHDVVIGCRYTEGGGTTDWGVGRKMISRGGNIYAQAILWLPFKDLTGGFKCFRRRVLETLPLDEIFGGGYVFQIELTYRSVKLGFSV